MVYVTDASRAVGVCSNLLSTTLRDDYVAGIKADYAKTRELHASKKGQGARYTLAQAREHGLKTDWKTYTPPKPSFIGVHKFEAYPLDKIAEYIDWTPFFQAWELAGRYPKILQDEVVGEEARKLFDDAQAMLKKIIAEKWLTANAVFGLFPANTVNSDDIEIYTDESRSKVAMTWHNLRQQTKKPADIPNYVPGRFRRAQGNRRGGLHRRVRRHHRHRHRRARRGIRKAERRLQRHHAQGAGRPPGRSLRRTAARPRAPRILGLCGGRRTWTTTR